MEITSEKLKAIETLIDETLDAETTESLTEWLLEKRKKNKPKEIIIAQENFVYFSKDKKFKIVLTKRGAETVNANPDKYEYICSAPHADGDFSYCCGSDYCRCAQ